LVFTAQADISLYLGADYFVTGRVFPFQGYLYSSAVQLCGVELNGQFCQLQEMIIKKYQFGDRIKVPLPYFFITSMTLS
jgi:hypothetical protein